MQREPGPQCHECGAVDDTAQHTLEECNRWVVERVALRAVTGVADLSLHSIIVAMLGSERKWEAVASFCEKVMSQKEKAERSEKHLRMRLLSVAGGRVEGGEPMLASNLNRASGYRTRTARPRRRCRGEGDQAFLIPPPL
ncbi:uncharacterized protein LOC133519794 [Cydia pomonella]|uniref:uncharacterized protein LOC133519794 n=1 Tax=Cydia pomonella TaxID=82600 RepID=UPI002ADE8FC6|nr:uncharacterized protein LOC133519794 [Cydia pomonella]